MRNALAKLNDEQRDELLYLADFSIAVCLSGLIVCILKACG